MTLLHGLLVVLWITLILAMMLLINWVSKDDPSGNPYPDNDDNHQLEEVRF